MAFGKKNRSHANRKSDKKSFSRNAVRTHKKNLRANPMRGGFRL